MAVDKNARKKAILAIVNRFNFLESEPEDLVEDIFTKLEELDEVQEQT